MEQNQKLEKLFCTYNQAKELKELGMDEPCLAYYTERDINLDKEGNKTNFVLLSAKLRGELSGHGTVKNSLFKWLKDNDKTSGELYTLSNSCTAPLKQQAFFFALINYNLCGSIIPVWSNVKYWYSYQILNITNGYKENCSAFETYQQAESECIDKLISLIKNK